MTERLKEGKGRSRINDNEIMVANKDCRRKTGIEKKEGDRKIIETKVLGSPV